MTRARAAGGANVVTVPWAPDLLTRPKRVRSSKAKYRASEQTNERTNELNLHSECLGLYNTMSKWLALLRRHCQRWRGERGRDAGPHKGACAIASVGGRCHACDDVRLWTAGRGAREGESQACGSSPRADETQFRRACHSAARGAARRQARLPRLSTRVAWAGTDWSVPWRRASNK